MVTVDHAINTVLAQAAQLHEAGRLQDAEIIYRGVLERQPGNPDALRLLALLAHQLGKPEIAAEYLTQAATARPNDAQIPTDMGVVQLALGNAAAAEQSFQQALAVNPGKATALLGLGNARYAQAKHEEAIDAFNATLALDPGLLDAHTNLGNALQALGRWPEALLAYEGAIALAPGDSTAHSNAGVVLHRLGRLPEAMTHYQAALSGATPAYDTICNFGNTLQEAGYRTQAVEVFTQAVQQQPARARAHSGLAGSLIGLFRPDDALPAATAALALDAEDDGARVSLAKGLWMVGEPERAAQVYQTLHQTQPEGGHQVSAATLLPIILASRHGVLMDRKRFVADLESLPSDMVLADPLLQIRSPFYLAYQGHNDARLQQQLADVYLKAHPGLGYVAPNCLTPPARSEAGRKVRVGFASAYLSEHTIGRLAQGIIDRLDREHFDVSVIHLGGAADGVAAEIDASADQALHLTGSLSEMQQAVAGLQLDTLVYPEIGMEPRAYFLAFARLAPVQCAMWGHPVTTGIPNMDYFISSRLLEPGGAHSHYTEKLVKLDRLPVHYQRPQATPAPANRASFGFSDSDHLYLCPQSLFKLHPDFDPVVASILRADPKGRLVLLEGMSAHWAELLRRRYAETLGDVADRVVLLPRQDREGFLRLLQTADAMLDPLHFGGGNSTYEALALGVPIVTLPGSFMRGRVTAGCYQQMDMTDLIAADASDYVEKSLRLAHDPAWRTAMVERIHQTSAALFDDDTVVRELERFLLNATRAHVAKAPGRAAWAA